MDRKDNSTMTSKKAVLIALLIPITALLILLFYKRSIVLTGTQVILPITGYDPRDLLSGYYLIYDIDYGVRGLCRGVTFDRKRYVCLNSKRVFLTRPSGRCPLFIQGVCQGGQFKAGIERYYASKQDAKKLEELVPSGKMSVLLSVSKSGKAQVKDLLINGKSWKD